MVCGDINRNFKKIDCFSHLHHAVSAWCEASVKMPALWYFVRINRCDSHKMIANG